MRTRRGSWICGIALGALVVPGAVAADETPVGEVTALSGQVSAVRDGGTPRPLSCGDPVYEGESVVTSPGSGAGLLLGDDLLAQVGETSSLKLGRTAAGTPDATLQKGAVRVIDAREGQQPARLAAGTASARLEGGDSEAYLLAEKAGGYAMFCEWDAPLAVDRGNETRTATPTECVIAKPDEPLYVAKAHEERMPAGPDGCPPANIAALGPHFPDAADVAAGPPAVAFSAGPDALPGFIMMPCEDPGAACVGVLVNEVPPTIPPTIPGGNPFPGTPTPPAP